MQQNLIEHQISVKITFGNPQEKMKIMSKKFNLPYKLSVEDCLDLPLYNESKVIYSKVNPLDYSIDVSLNELNIEDDNEGVFGLEHHEKCEEHYNEIIESFKSEGWK